MGDARLHARVLLYGNKESYLRMLKTHSEDLCSMRLRQDLPAPAVRSARSTQRAQAAAPNAIGPAFFFPDGMPTDEN